MPFPQNYQAAAARIIAQRGADASVAQVSYPRPTLGTSPTAPQRWYVCVLGVSQVAKPDTLPRVADLIDRFFDPRANAGVHNVVLFFNASARPSVRDGYDSPLCRDGAYERVTAKAPLT